MDLDASVVLVDESGKFVDAVYYNQLKSKCESVIHSGDTKTGAGDHDEKISINLK